MAVREVLILLDGENLRERGVAPRDPGHQQPNEMMDGDRVERVASRELLEGLLRERERFLIIGIERASRSIGPLVCAPARIERHESSDRDVPNLATREADAHWLGIVRPQLPQHLGKRLKLLGLDAAAKV